MGDLTSTTLIASPRLECPFFSGTVVALVDHQPEGAIGFVVNRSADLQFDQVIRQAGLSCDTSILAAAVMQGGPVSSDTGWLGFDPRSSRDMLREYPEEGLIRVHDGFCVSANIDMLEVVARGNGPSRFAMYLGYAGWGPGQLDEEISDGSWIISDLDPALIFDAPLEKRWELAMESMGIDPLRYVSNPQMAQA